jgi:hypothetical protein
MENALKQLKKVIVTPSQSETLVRPSHVLGCIITLYLNSKELPRPSQLIEVLLGVAMPSRLTLPNDISFFDESLNDSQMAAVKFALESVEVACIHGPPGDGVW